jgi:glucosylceramidase
MKGVVLVFLKGWLSGMKIKKIVTDFQNNAYWEESEQSLNEINPMIAVCVYPERTYQEVKGFGGAFTEAGAYNLSLLAQENQEAVIEAFFGKDGLHYNLCRTHINSCDFGLGNYAYLEKETDAQLSGFSIERDEKYLIPMINLAKEKSSEDIVLLASPWSPPAFMKSNKEMNNGGYLLKEYYSMWADYIVRYIKEYEKLGITISMLTIQNEPQAVQTWDSCIYSTEDEKIMVKDHLGPALKENGLDHIKILIWDHNKDIIVERSKGVLADKEANQFVNGVAFHWYSGDHFEALALVKEMYPDKELYFTEGCVEYSRFMDSDEVAKAEMYAHDIIGNFNAGMNGYMDWNMLLDEQGGPNHVSNFCAAPIMCNPKENTIEKRLCYYYIGHFSRYIIRGARRLAISRYTDKLDITGFVNPDGERVIVVMNKTDKDVEFSLKELEDGGCMIINKHSIQTICYQEEKGN